MKQRYLCCRRDKRWLKAVVACPTEQSARVLHHALTFFTRRDWEEKLEVTGDALEDLVLSVSGALSDARVRETRTFIEEQGEKLARLSEAERARRVEEFWLREARRRPQPEPFGLRQELRLVDPFDLDG